VLPHPSAEAAPQASEEDPATAAWAARQLGLHYLKRYFLLIAFACYLRTDDAPSPSAGPSPIKGLPGQATAGGGGGAPVTPVAVAGGAGAPAAGHSPAAGKRGGFVGWAGERKELGHLLHHLTLET
jgi:hypothetical protein